MCNSKRLFHPTSASNIFPSSSNKKQKVNSHSSVCGAKQSRKNSEVAKVPNNLKLAWSVCTPADEPLKDQLAPLEEKFLLKFSEYINEKCPTDQDSTTKQSLIDEILDVTKSRVAVLVKQVTPAITHAVMAVVLRLLSNLIDKDFFKYKTVEDMLEVYPTFADRSDKEKENLLSTANWMSVLFRVIPARKNKGIAMDIVPKFVEGNCAHYVTGGGQTRSTQDRVDIYETEGGCKASKRTRHKDRKFQLDDSMFAEANKQMMDMLAQCYHLPPKYEFGPVQSHTTVPANSVMGVTISDMMFNPLASYFSQDKEGDYVARHLPVPAMPPRSMSSFSEAAEHVSCQNVMRQKADAMKAGGRRATSVISPSNYFCSDFERSLSPNSPTFFKSEVSDSSSEEDEFDIGAFTNAVLSENDEEDVLELLKEITADSDFKEDECVSLSE